MSFHKLYLPEYVNDFDQPLVFQCPHGGVLDGVSSYHDNHREDRRFKFYCCEKPGYNWNVDRCPQDINFL